MKTRVCLTYFENDCRSCKRALKNQERRYMLDSSNKSKKLNEVAQLELYRDSHKDNFLVVSKVL